jgi:F-type H+-transporting ATPase subunit epsilon
MKVEILTPEKRIFDGEVDILTVPTRSGLISVMSNHAALVTAVKSGDIILQIKGEKKVFEVEDGVLETLKNKTILLLRKCREK